jgi:hypothetical protein
MRGPIMQLGHIRDGLTKVWELEKETLAPVTKPVRRKHVCKWSDQEVWGVFVLALLLGLFLGHFL